MQLLAVQPGYGICKTCSANEQMTMSDRSLFRLVHLPPDLAAQLRESVDEAFQSLGSATAELILHYARRKHNVNVKELPVGIEELDNALREVLGTGRRMVVNHCAEVLSRRLGKDIRTKSEKLTDVFKQVSEIYRRRKATGDSPSSLFGDVESVEETVISHNVID